MDFEDLLNGFVIGAIAALISAVIQLVVTNMTLQDNLDSKSGWRKELFDVASRDDIDIKDVNTLRATLRYKEKKYTDSHWKHYRHVLIWFIITILSIMVLNWVTFSKNGNPLKDAIVRNVCKYFLGGDGLAFFCSSILIVFIVFLAHSVIKMVKLLDFRSLDFCNICLKEIKRATFVKSSKLTGKKIIVEDLYKLFSKLGEEEIDKYPLYFFNFDSMTKTIIDFCSAITEENLTKDDQEKVKIYSRYMLKHHWEDLSVPNYRLLKKLEVRIKDNIAVRDTIKQILNVKSDKTLVYPEQIIDLTWEIKIKLKEECE